MFPESAQLTRLRSPEDAADVLRTLEAIVRPSSEQAEIRQLLADLLDQGRLSLAFVADSLGLRYFDVAVRPGRLIFPISRSDPVAFERDVAAARLAVGGRVVVDLSSLVVAAHLADVWLHVRRAVAQTVVPVSSVHALMDLQISGGVPAGYMSWNADGRRVIFVEYEEHEQEELEGLRNWLLAETPDLHAEIVSANLGEESATTENTTWLDSVTLARQLDLPLLCDDVRQRLLAEANGVVCFSTWGFCEATGFVNAVSPRHNLPMRIFMLGGVDLPVPADAVLGMAESAGFRTNQLAIQLARPALWADSPTLFSQLARLFEATRDRELEFSYSVLKAACVGFTRSGQGFGRQLRFMASLFVIACIVRIRDPERVSVLLLAVREACEDVGLPDPLSECAVALWESCVEVAGAANGGRLFAWLLSNLDSEDRLVALGAALGQGAQGGRQSGPHVNGSPPSDRR